MNKARERTFKNYILICVKGLGMGAADIVPGVSGGTIAFITGIYEELINSLKSFTPKNFKLIFTGRLRAFWKAVNGNFIAALILGVGASLVSLARIVLYMLNVHPTVTWSFFFGLIMISTVQVLKTVHKTSLPVFAGFGAGAVVAYLLTVTTAAQTPNDAWFVFVCGAVAICAMILPGISGSFILLLMGKYEYILGALNGFKVTVLAVFASGAIIGLLSFSHFLSLLLRKYRDVTVALLAGFMCGSLNKVWPWKVLTNAADNEILPWNMDRINDRSIQWMEKNCLPHVFEQTTGIDARILHGLAAAATAIALCMAIDAIGRKMEAKSRG